jgi:hypothetical protein
MRGGIGVKFHQLPAPNESPGHDISLQDLVFSVSGCQHALAHPFFKILKMLTTPQAFNTLQ